MSRPARILLVALTVVVAIEFVVIGLLLAQVAKMAGRQEQPSATSSAHTPTERSGPARSTDVPESAAVTAPVEYTPSLAPPPATATEPAPPIQATSKYGIHLLLDDGRNHWLPEVWPQHVSAARQIVGRGGYVVQLIRLDDLDVGRWQFFLDLCAREEVVPIVRLAATFDHTNKWWEAPPQDADGQGYRQVARQYRDFFAKLRWPSDQRYVIVGNEANRGDEWSNRPNPAEYARFLVDVSQALRSVGVTVLGPALDLYAPHSNGQLIGAYRYIDAETFMDEMAAAQPGVFEAIDIWASHAYPLDPFRFDPARQQFRIDYANGASNPRHVQPPEGIFNRGVNSYHWELWKLEQITGRPATTMPVMITETGWRHAPSQNPFARDDVHAEVSFETLSAYADLAFHGNGGRYPGLPDAGWTPWDDDSQVLAVVFFALGGLPSDWGHTNWVMVDDRGQVVDLYPITMRR